MKWCNENEIDVNDIFLIDQMASMQQHHSIESYAAICKQTSVIKNSSVKWSDPGHEVIFFLPFPCTLFLHIFDI